MSIYNFPLYYISFTENKEIENHYRENGFRNVHHFSAVDGRKMDIQKLRDDNLITIRSYNDLIAGRNEHSGMPSLGAIGCTMSHCALWKKCVDNNWSYIIIAEEDNRMYGKISDDKEKKIMEILGKPKSVFISGDIWKLGHRDHFFGTHFYIASLDACKLLAKDCFPIDVQTDWYMGHLSTTNEITLEGFKVSRQKKNGSLIQDNCIICWLPTKMWFYTLLILFVIGLIVFYFRKRKQLEVCRSSCSSEE